VAGIPDGGAAVNIWLDGHILGRGRLGWWHATPHPPPQVHALPTDPPPVRLSLPDGCGNSCLAGAKTNVLFLGPSRNKLFCLTDSCRWRRSPAFLCHAADKLRKEQPSLRLRTTVYARTFAPFHHLPWTLPPHQATSPFLYLLSCILACSTFCTRLLLLDISGTPRWCGMSAHWHRYGLTLDLEGVPASNRRAFSTHQHLSALPSAPVTTQMAVGWTIRMTDDGAVEVGRAHTTYHTYRSTAQHAPPHLPHYRACAKAMAHQRRRTRQHRATALQCQNWCALWASSFCVYMLACA